MGPREPGTARVRRPRHNARYGVALTLLVVGLAVACGGEQRDAPSGEVVLYTSMPDSVVNRLAGVIERRSRTSKETTGFRWAPV